MEELIKAIKLAPNKKTPDATLISYETLKHLDPVLLEEIFSLFNSVLRVHFMSNDWLISNIILFPKSKDWKDNLDLVRSITLLKSIWKIFTKIITIQTQATLLESNTLSPYNFATLPGIRTTYPLKIINTVIEQSREQKTEAWLLFQDIHRAFNSIDPYYLTKVLERVRILEQIINIIIYTLANRKAQVITEYRLTEEFHIKRGESRVTPCYWPYGICFTTP